MPIYDGRQTAVKALRIAESALAKERERREKLEAALRGLVSAMEKIDWNRHHPHPSEYSAWISIGEALTAAQQALKEGK